MIEVAPDLLGLTDVAEMLGVSRQNMRKVMPAHPGSFPAPVHEGSASIWHLADVLTWLQAKGFRCWIHADQCIKAVHCGQAPMRRSVKESALKKAYLSFID